MFNTPRGIAFGSARGVVVVVRSAGRGGLIEDVARNVVVARFLQADSLMTRPCGSSITLPEL